MANCDSLLILSLSTSLSLSLCMSHSISLRMHRFVWHTGLFGSGDAQVQHVRRLAGLFAGSGYVSIWKNLYVKLRNPIFIISHCCSWACGVIMFTLLVGCPPFWHRKQMVMLRNIMEGKYSFTSPEWADISGELAWRIKRERERVILMVLVLLCRGSQRSDTQMSSR